MAQDPRALLQKVHYAPPPPSVTGSYRANVLYHEQAQKTLDGAGSGFSFFGGREEKYQNAADTFVQAGNAFKMQQQRTTTPLP